MTLFTWLAVAVTLATQIYNIISLRKRIQAIQTYREQVLREQMEQFAAINARYQKGE